MLWICKTNPCGSRDPDPGPGPVHKILNFYILKVSNRSQNIPTKVQKPFFKAGVSPASGNQICLFNFGQFPCSGIRNRIHIPNMDPDPGQRNQCVPMRIHNTGMTCTELTSLPVPVGEYRK